MKQPGVFSGQHTINLKISDIQGEFVVYNLSVTLCDCTGTSTCKTQRSTTTKAASHALGIIFASWLLLLSKKPARWLMTYPLLLWHVVTHGSFCYSCLTHSSTVDGSCRFAQKGVCQFAIWRLLWGNAPHVKHRDTRNRLQGQSTETLRMNAHLSRPLSIVSSVMPIVFPPHKVPDFVRHSPVVSSVEYKDPPKTQSLSDGEQHTTKVGASWIISTKYFCSFD